MRTLNLQLTAIVMAIGIVFGGGVFFLHGYQVQRNAYVFKHESELLEERAQGSRKEKGHPGGGDGLPGCRHRTFLGTFGSCRAISMRWRNSA